MQLVLVLFRQLIDYYLRFLVDLELSVQQIQGYVQHYLDVLQQNRERLKDRGVYSRLNLYLTTTFGYEIMVGLYYGAVIDAVSVEVSRRTVNWISGTTTPSAYNINVSAVFSLADSVADGRLCE